MSAESESTTGRACTSASSKSELTSSQNGLGSRARLRRSRPHGREQDASQRGCRRCRRVAVAGDRIGHSSLPPRVRGLVVVEERRRPGSSWERALLETEQEDDVERPSCAHARSRARGAAGRHLLSGVDSRTLERSQHVLQVEPHLARRGLQLVQSSLGRPLASVHGTVVVTGGRRLDAPAFATSIQSSPRATG